MLHHLPSDVLQVILEFLTSLDSCSLVAAYGRSAAGASLDRFCNLRYFETFWYDRGATTWQCSLAWRESFSGLTMNMETRFAYLNVFLQTYVGMKIRPIPTDGEIYFIMEIGQWLPEPFRVHHPVFGEPREYIVTSSYDLMIQFFCLAKRTIPFTPEQSLRIPLNRYNSVTLHSPVLRHCRQITLIPSESGFFSSLVRENPFSRMDNSLLMSVLSVEIDTQSPTVIDNVPPHIRCIRVETKHPVHIVGAGPDTFSIIRDV